MPILRIFSTFVGLLLLLVTLPQQTRASSWQMPESSYPNPFWPSGASNKDVETLVDMVMKDKTINVLAIPDRLERQIYRTTILLVVNTFYENLAYYHGTPVMGHELRWIRLRNYHRGTTTNVLQPRSWTW